MTYEEAKRILHPNTTLEALTEIEYYAGFHGEQAKRDAVDEACVVACEALEKQIPKKPIPYEKDSEEVLEEYSCPECNAPYDVLFDGKLKFCPNCGQRLKWGENE